MALVAISAIPMSFADKGVYEIEAEEKKFDVSYSFDGDVVAIDVDQESASLLVGIKNVKASTFEISFPSELLAAKDSQFVVLVDSLETDYTVTYADGKYTIAISIPETTEEIEIIGTSVIPEFPVGVLMMMGIISAMILVFSKTKIAVFK